MQDGCTHGFDSFPTRVVGCTLCCRSSSKHLASILWRLAYGRSGLHHAMKVAEEIGLEHDKLTIFCVSAPEDPCEERKETMAGTVVGMWRDRKKFVYTSAWTNLNCLRHARSSFNDDETRLTLSGVGTGSTRVLCIAQCTTARPANATRSPCVLGRIFLRQMFCSSAVPDGA